jgi:hypothetical protein
LLQSLCTHTDRRVGPFALYTAPSETGVTHSDVFNVREFRERCFLYVLEKHRKCGPTLFLFISSRFPLTHSSPERRLSHFVTYVFIYFPVANVCENSPPSRRRNPSLSSRRSFHLRKICMGVLGLILRRSFQFLWLF